MAVTTPVWAFQYSVSDSYCYKGSWLMIVCLMTVLQRLLAMTDSPFGHVATKSVVHGKACACLNASLQR